MKERCQAANEDTTTSEDVTNVRSKLMKHKAFEAELAANKIKIDGLKETGAEIVDVDPEKKPEVRDEWTGKRGKTNFLKYKSW